ncbi:MAG: hypothetical protein ACON3Z_05050 [Bradymonadia bacterium]
MSVRFYKLQLVIGLFALACGHPLDPPTPHGYIDPSSTVVETEPSDEPPSVRDPHISAPTATVIGTAHTPGATPLQTPRVRGEWLPSSSDRLGFLSADYKRYSIWDAKVVGLHCSQTRCLAATRHGGLFETSSLGDWRPLTTSLPTLERVYFGANVWVACPADGRHALIAEGDDARWYRGDFHCTSGVYHGISLDGSEALVLDRGQLRIGPIGHGVSRRFELPIDNPRVLIADEELVFIFGDSGMAVSNRLTPNFTVLPAIPHLQDVYAGAIGPKGLIVVVGQGRANAPPVALSYDRGRTWVAPDWPHRVAALHYVSVGLDGRFALTRDGGRGTAFVGDPLGRQWARVETGAPLRGPSAPWRSDFVYASPLGLGLSPDERGLYPLQLDQSLSQIIGSGLNLLGLGQRGDVFRSADGGLTWFAAGPSHRLGFTKLLHVRGDHLIGMGHGTAGYSADRGQTWRVESMPNGCGPVWLVGDGLSQFAGCTDGATFRRDGVDGPWSVMATLRGFTQAVWSSDAQELYLWHGPTSRLHLSADRGVTWSEIELPELGHDGVRSMRTAPDSIAFLTGSGRIARFDTDSRQLFWLSSQSPTLPNIDAFHQFADASFLLLNHAELWQNTPENGLEFVMSVPGSERLMVLRNGDLFLGGSQTMTRLQRVTDH